MGSDIRGGTHESAVRRRGIGPGGAERTEAGSFAGDLRERVEKVVRRSRQAVEARDLELCSASLSAVRRAGAEVYQRLGRLYRRQS